MSLKDLISARQHLEYIQGVEQKLLKRKYVGKVGLWIGIVGASLQVIAELSENDSIIRVLKAIEDGTLLDFLQRLSPLSILGFILLIIGLCTWFFLRYTRVLMRESREPFRYTFWINPFERIGEEVGKVLFSGDQFHPKDEYLSGLLSHDLMERLNRRIKRLSLLEIPQQEDENKTYRAHIEVDGHYTVRTTKKGWLLQVMPKVSIGGKNAPKHLTHQINFPLKAGKNPTLDDADYSKVVERIYSRLATEIYNQIQGDLKEKITLFPTNYLRASALAVEAEDFARSNTIDAYGHAIELYESALRYFRVATFTHFKRFVLSLPFIWATSRFHHKLAEIQIGYAKSTFYKWYISTLSGRKRNSIYALPAQMDQVIYMLTRTHNRLVKRKWRLTIPPFGDAYLSGELPSWLIENRRRSTMAYLSFPPDNWLRSKLFKPTLTIFQRQQKVLFEAYLVSAIAYLQLNNVKCAREMLKNAEAIRPGDKEQDPLYLLASGILEPKLIKKILLLRKATEAAPDFEIAQFMLASKLDLHFRNQNHLQKDRAEIALQEYQKTLGINHGNLSALTAMAYIHWLLGENEEARNLFEQGLEFKTIFKQVYSAEIYYGLARIYAEGGASTGGTSDTSTLQHSVVKAYEYFNQAISLDPNVGIYYNANSYSATTDYYYHISPAILNRLEQYCSQAQKHLLGKKLKTSLFTGRGYRSMAESVFSYVLNDYGNAALNYYFRFGSLQKRDLAENLYTRALEYDAHNKVAPFGQAQILLDKGQNEEARTAYAISAGNNDDWELAIISLLRSRLNDIVNQLRSDLQTAEQLERENTLGENSFRDPTESRQEWATSVSVKKGVPGPDSNEILPNLQQKITLHQKINFNTFIVNLKQKNQELLKSLLLDFYSHFENSNLGALFKTNLEQSVEAIVELLQNKPEMSRMNEKDVRLLQLYNEILLHHVTNDSFYKALYAARLLREYFISEDFNYRRSLLEAVNLRLHWQSIDQQTQEHSPDDVELGEFQAKAEEDLKRNVEFWLEEDVINFATLTWAHDYLPPDDYLKALDGALMESHIYHDYELQGVVILKSRKLLHLSQDLIRINSHSLAYASLVEAYDKNPFDAEICAYLLIAAHHSPYPDISPQELVIASRNDADPKTLIRKQTINRLEAIGGILKTAGDLELALKCFRLLLRQYLRKPSERQAHIYAELAECLRNDYEKRLEELEKGSTLNPDDARLHNLLGIAFFERQNYQQAIVHFKCSTEIDPTNAQYFCNMADSLLRQGQMDEALQQYDLAIEKARQLDQREEGSTSAKNEAYFINMKGLGYYTAKDYHNAALLFNTAAQLDPLPLYYANLGNAFLLEQKLVEAEQAYQNALHLDPRDDDNYNWLGIAKFRQGNFKDAASDFKKAIELNGSIPQYYINLADSYKKQDKLRKAREPLITASRLASSQNLSSAYLSYNDVGVIYYHDKKFEKALEYFSEAHRLQPDDMIVVLNIGDSYLYSERYEDAEQAYRKALEVLLNRADIHSGLAEALYNQGNKAWAMEHYGVAYRNDPGNQFSLLRIWRTLFEMELEERQFFIPSIVREFELMQSLNFDNIRKTVISQLRLLHNFKNGSLPLFFSKLSLKLLLAGDRMSRGPIRRV